MVANDSTRFISAACRIGGHGPGVACIDALRDDTGPTPGSDCDDIAIGQRGRAKPEPRHVAHRSSLILDRPCDFDANRSANPWEGPDFTYGDVPGLAPHKDLDHACASRQSFITNAAEWRRQPTSRDIVAHPFHARAIQTTHAP